MIQSSWFLFWKSRVSRLRYQVAKVGDFKTALRTNLESFRGVKLVYLCITSVTTNSWRIFCKKNKNISVHSYRLVAKEVWNLISFHFVFLCTTKTAL
jgi:hypothetical protein